ncbi:UTP--glucose-1-phosphate uridylyltransferase 3, chloroplastic [Apium graveolens]|uniref:UTP--glucose-1-phosphate uridylyltransferase 3, chloroplastic n=1 Tax=Apium graveolens TaxID=4045 RepID=UPI003D7AFD51
MASTSSLHNTHLLFIPQPKPSSFFPKNTHTSTYSYTYNNNIFASSFITKPSLTSLSSSSSHISRVSTAPVEHAPSPSDFNFHKEIAQLKTLRSCLSNLTNLNEKVKVIDRDDRVKSFFRTLSTTVFGVLEEAELYLIKCVVAAGQEHLLKSDEFEFEFESKRSSLKTALYGLAEMIENWDTNKGIVKSVDVERIDDEEIKALRLLVKNLGEVEQFYDCIGGIIGYQIMVLELLVQSTYVEQGLSFTHMKSNLMESQVIEIHPPNVLDLCEDTEYAFQAALWGIEGLPDLGEIYPLGGSADRLGLVDPVTGECLPAAMLPYCGRTLLEGLIRDLQAREFLYFKLYAKQCVSPVAIMTSSAKNNHKHITSLCEKMRWFGRGRSRFKLFEQPLVPAVSAEDGQWLVAGKFFPVCRPGGHGAIWKLAHDKGVFQHFRDYGRKGATVRQVSNVVAATDLTILALAGIGLRHNKKLGFASCERNSGATEGINVLLEKKNRDGMWAYGFSCIEYTEFDKFGISNGPLSKHSLQAEFPANTNILYVDLHSAELIGSSNNETSLPGMVLNVKKPITYMDQCGIHHRVSGGRLECTMQNIADSFVNTYPSRCYKGVEDLLDTFIVYNDRRKVTSSAKKKRKHADKSLHQTPDGSLLDIIRNSYDLLSRCDIKIPEIGGNDKYADSGPPYLIFLHPALGPLWEVTRQKFSGGSITKGSELQIEVAEFLWKDVQLDGSLIVIAENVMGSTIIDQDGESILQYGHRCGRCKLENVKIVNDGIDWNSSDNIYWKHEVQRFEVVKVILHGNAEFEAVDVILQGNHTFDVPSGYSMKVSSANSGFAVHLKPIKKDFMDSGSWYWKYHIKGSHVQLEMVER